MKKQSFEENMDRLEEIVSLLEQGDATLGESLTLFTEGSKLLPPAKRSWKPPGKRWSSSPRVPMAPLWKKIS